jgi:hypothetical protein
MNELLKYHLKARPVETCPRSDAVEVIGLLRWHVRTCHQMRSEPDVSRGHVQTVHLEYGI